MPVGSEDPWSYLRNFSIGAGSADSYLISTYQFLYRVGTGIGLVLIMTAIVGIIWTSNARHRAQRKQVLYRRLLAVFFIGLSTTVLGLIMTICNTVFQATFK